MLYELMHKDTQISLIDISYKALGEEVKIVDFSPTHLIPYGVRENPLNPLSISEQGMFKWLMSRALPLTRAYAREILRASGITHLSLQSLIDKSNLVSLHDSYWLRAYNSCNLSWDKVNLYTNKPSQAISKVAFGIGGCYSSDRVTSPEYTTDGSLAKSWLLKAPGKYVLRKANGNHNEAYNEFYCSQVLSQMGLRHVDYTLSKHRGQVVSLCDNFSTESFGCIPFSHIWRYSLDFESILNYISSNFNSSILLDFERMILFDCIVSNEDRHSNNFGFIINNSTNEIISLAPIFDNGISLLGDCLGSYSSFKVLHLDLLNYLLSLDASLSLALRNIEGITQHSIYKLKPQEFEAKQSIIRKAMKMANFDAF